MPGYVELFIRLSHIPFLLPPPTPDQTHTSTPPELVELKHTHKFILKHTDKVALDT